METRSSRAWWWLVPLVVLLGAARAAAQPPPPALPEPAPETETAAEPAADPAAEQAPGDPDVEVEVVAPAPPVAPQPPGLSPAASRPGLSAREQCVADRRRRLLAARAIDNLGDRTAALEAIQACEPPAAAVASELPARAADHAPRSGVTGEIAGGVGSVAGQTVGALGLGVGGFLTSNAALTARVAGVVYIGLGTAFFGFAGPSVQVWATDRLWLGGGAGLGLVAGCADDCLTLTAPGLDFRAGLSLTPPGRPGALSLSLEATSFDPAGDDSLQTVSLLLGYQGL